MEETVRNDSCVMLARLLAEHGVKHVVVSPGSRNAPLIVALHRMGCFNIISVIDERSAAFMALGMASLTGSTVVIVCTSGSALLNYAPAVAEACYRGVPLLVASADRPEEWIDQDDSQTIRQFKSLDNLVKHSYDLPAFTGSENLMWMVERTINDAIVKCVDGRPGPVHLNIRIDEPLTEMRPFPHTPVRSIEVVRPRGELTTAFARELGAELASPKKVLIIAGFHSPDQRLVKAIGKLAALPNVAVMAEAQSNLYMPHGNAVMHIDLTLSSLSPETLSDMLPDYVITYGGSLLSRMVKAWIRGAKHRVRHWHVGLSENAIDCFQCLEKRIEMRPADFFPRLASAMQIWKAPSSYGRDWLEISRRAASAKGGYIESVGWSDLRAMKMVMASLPSECNLQLSNGTAVRYAQLFPYSRFHRIDCNRGVSGIDGCTSTAIGASLVYNGPTVLITGDMSAQYDIGALAFGAIPARFKMVVLNNGGGGIFRFIKSTSGLEELDRYFVADVRLPLGKIAEGFGFRYFECADPENFPSAFQGFIHEKEVPAILNVITPGVESAEILRHYFEIKI